MRINKYLSGAGYCSRREADRLVEAGRVTVNGETASMGSQVEEGQIVCVDGNVVATEEEMILLAVNKPVGIVCTTTDKQGKNNIVDFIGYHKRIYPVGRLDKDSEGLLLMTNNGDIMDKILRSANGHEKEYIVEVDKCIDDIFLKKMSEGVYLSELDRTTKPCKIYKEGRCKFRIIITQGLNRQIRRMCSELGREVVSLKRVRIMNVLLGDLPVGSYREVTKEEYRRLCEATESNN
ncbi:MAG: pseudouridine synthase [Lachnospira sp.]|nr:pseudouridine synthase [Lachnospira sp.]